MHNDIHYESLLVVLSYVISVLGSYTALQLAIAIPQARDRLAAFGWSPARRPRWVAAPSGRCTSSP